MTPEPDLFDKLRSVTDVVQFGICPAQIARTANSWQAEASTIGAITYAPLRIVGGNSSRTFAAVRSAERPARSATDAIGDRMGSMSSLLRWFTATTGDNDASAARRFDDLTPR